MDPSGFPYKVLQGDTDKGRTCVASRYLSPGEIVLTERAAACVAAPTRSLCDDCLTHIDANDSRREMHRQCASCRSLFDLGAASGMNTKIQEPPSPAVRLSAKLLFRRLTGRLGQELASRIDSLMHKDNQQRLSDARRGDSDTINSNSDKDSGSSSSTGRDWSEQEEDCIKARQRDTAIAKAVAKLAAGMAYGVAVAGTAGRVLLPAADGLGKEGTLLDLARKELRRVCMNAITTCDGSGATGLGLCPSGAMFNHSCTPNCQAWWRDSKLEIRCTKFVGEGEELCFSYIHIDEPSAIRQEQLRRSWFFTCCCRRCSSQEWDTELTGLRCPVSTCAGAVPSPRGSDYKGKGSGGGGGGGGGEGGEGAFCNQCGSGASVGAQSARFARPTQSEGSTPDQPGNGADGILSAIVGSPSCRADPATRRPRAFRAGVEHGDAGIKKQSGAPADTTRRTPSERGPMFSDRKCRDEGDEDEQRLLAKADRLFEDGVEAYMREDPEIALVALEKSLLVRETVLHPFNKVLLRTLRYCSMAAIATCSWGKAHAFLNRWLHPMDTMFGAAEVWDIAAMRIDDGLVLEQLTATATNVPGMESGAVQRMASAPPAPRSVETINRLQKTMTPSVPPEAAAAGGLHPAAYRELAQGLRDLWIGLGRDTGLPAETAALQLCAEYGINL
ncbi:unnamed protein product [Scytosiphon promiscuus]